MIDISRRPETGDMVRASIIVDLMPATVHGMVIDMTPYAARLHLYVEFGDAGRTLTDPPTFVDVALDRLRVQIDPYDMLRYCLRQFKLIAAQDQGGGGSASAPECWRAAQRIATESANNLGAISDEVGGKGKL